MSYEKFIVWKSISYKKIYQQSTITLQSLVKVDPDKFTHILQLFQPQVTHRVQVSCCPVISSNSVFTLRSNSVKSYYHQCPLCFHSVDKVISYKHKLKRRITVIISHRNIYQLKILTLYTQLSFVTNKITMQTFEFFSTILY